jgi:aspartate aminotransferase-like enzyme
VDCISSIGTIPVDLNGVYLASGVSGKGLAAFPGLSMVFYSYAAQPAPARLPRYLDLGLYASHGGAPFTHSSNLLAALAKATEHRGRCFEDLAQLSAWLRPQLRERGFVIVAPDAHASPAVITIALPAAPDSSQVGAQLAREGFLLSYQSQYLLERNWIQICLMGEYSREDLESLVEALARASAGRVAAASGDRP